MGQENEYRGIHFDTETSGEAQEERAGREGMRRKEEDGRVLIKTRTHTHTHTHTRGGNIIHYSIVE